MAVVEGMMKITVCLLVPKVENGLRIEVMSILSNIPSARVMAGKY